MGTRYTAKSLHYDVEKYNGYNADIGSTVRYVSGGRNGYTAVDAYSVDADGNRIGSGVDRNVCCGSPRECLNAVILDYSNCYAYVTAKAQSDKTDIDERNAEFVASVVSLCRKGCDDEIPALCRAHGLLD